MKTPMTKDEAREALAVFLGQNLDEALLRDLAVMIDHLKRRPPSLVQFDRTVYNCDSERFYRHAKELFDVPLGAPAWLDRFEHLIQDIWGELGLDPDEDPVTLVKDRSELETGPKGP
jgi:hypothetical protein